MPELVSNLVDVYPYKMSGPGNEYLLLRRGPGTIYAGEWRMVGGKVKEGEASWEAARRELTEETGCTPVLLWTIPSTNSFYEWQSDLVRIASAFAAEINGSPTLNHEHDDSAWLIYEAAVERLRWPEQRRLLGIVHAELAREIPVSWRVE